MKALPLRLHSRHSFFSSLVVLAAAAGFTTGCGSSGSMSHSTTPALSGNTSVTLLLTSTANDQLDQFNLGFNSITLTSQSGKTVNLFTTSQNSTPPGAEFMHLNGSTEPLLTATVPQDVYTAATANIAPASFTCDAQNTSQNSLTTSTYAYGYVPANQVTLNLPTPITITGTAMGLSLDLLVSQSASFPSTCYPGSGIAQYAITPTFNVTPVSFSNPVPENLLEGQIASVDASAESFSVTLADGQTLTAKTNDSTLYQGISGFSLLTAGSLINMDAAIQSDGSHLARRIAVQDPDITNLSASVGPLLQVEGSVQIALGFEQEHQGYLTTSRQSAFDLPYHFGGVVFQVSGQLTNLQRLPFSAEFNASNMFPGQNVYTTSHATTVLDAPTYVPATTITLMPQTINGTVSAVGSDGGFATYTVALAAYDLIPNLAVQPGQTTVLADPNSVVVYTDSSTQMLNTQPLAVGSVVRFNGLLFDDNGTARMDCGRVNDGVPE